MDQLLASRRSFLLGSAFILLIFWASRHLLHGSFGFYEDDYTLVVRSMEATWAETGQFVVGRFVDTGGQGRPLQHSLIFALGRLTGSLGGLAPAYWLAFIIVGANAVLYFVLLRKVARPGFALLGGLSYALFSADTTQTFLYHAFGLQPSLTFLLFASLAYLSGRRLLGYIVILGALLSYETSYLVFAGIPLLERRWSRAWLRRLGRHVAVVLTILVVSIMVRAAAGEGRVSELDFPDVVTVPITHMIQGPPVAIGSYLLRPFQAIQGMNVVIALVVLAAFGVFWAISRRMPVPHYGKLRDWIPEACVRLGLAFGNRNEPVEADYPLSARLLQLLVAGLVMLALAYPLTFTVRPYAISGRDTRVHLSAAVGAPLLWTSAWYLLLSSVGSRRALSALRTGLAGLMALTVGFGVLVQQDYARAWSLQRRLWSSLAAEVRDFDDGLRIFVDPEGLIDTRYIDANTWSLPLVFQYVFGFPAQWEQPPRVYRLLPEWEERSLSNPTEIKALAYTWEYVVSPWSRTMVLETSDGRVQGRLATVRLDDSVFQLNTASGAEAQQWPAGFLYDALIDPSDWLEQPRENDG